MVEVNGFFFRAVLSFTNEKKRKSSISNSLKRFTRGIRNYQIKLLFFCLFCSFEDEKTLTLNEIYPIRCQNISDDFFLVNDGYHL